MIKIKPSELLGLIVIALLICAGCALFQRGSSAEYNTLASVGYTVDAAVSSYYGGVARGIVPTNNVPKVSRYYNDFQAGYRLALAAAESGNTNAAASDSLITLEANVLNAVGGIK